MDLNDLAGKTFGPVGLHVSTDGVADFVDATGDDPKRWQSSAPPGFLAVALFSVAPDLLALLYEHSVIHGEQSFTWTRPIEIGSELSISGVVSKARERGGVHFITFDFEAGDSRGSVATGSSLFLAAGDTPPIASSVERTEPAATDSGSPGEDQLSASRSGLIKYAAATRDWNPIHWDHEAAVEAGLAGVVAHGLLLASWALRIAARPVAADRPLASARVRFRNPLLPANPVDASIQKDGSTVDVVISDEANEYISARVVLADE